jgi:allophanate hydrolase
MLTGDAFHDRALAHLAELLLAPSVDLLVVGAHLTGQPLNGQLVSAGGSFAGAVTTAPSYRLFALETTPPKPGMLRVSSGGASVTGEVWTLPAAGFARFVAALPAPMTIGRVTLSDGRDVAGFLCEPIATENAADITRHGGWREWLDSTTAGAEELVSESMA